MSTLTEFLGGIKVTQDASGDNEVTRKSQVAAMIAALKTELTDGAGSALDTLNELADAIGNDADYAATITTALSGKLGLGGGTMTGPIILSGAPTENLHAATKNYVDSTIASELEGLDFASESYVNNAISTVVGAAPDAMNTLVEIAQALNDDADIAGTLTTAIGDKVAKAGDTMTGPLVLSGAPTQDSHAANKEYVDDQIATVTATVKGYKDASNDESIVVTSGETEFTVEHGLDSTAVALVKIQNTHDGSNPVSGAAWQTAPYTVVDADNIEIEFAVAPTNGAKYRVQVIAVV